MKTKIGQAAKLYAERYRSWNSQNLGTGQDPAKGERGGVAVLAPVVMRMTFDSRLKKSDKD